MKIFDKLPISFEKPKTKEAQKVAFMYAFLLVVFALCQLFSYDKFLALLQEFNLPFGEWLVPATGALIVISEVFALPFLLNMRLNKPLKLVSMVFSWLVAIIWLKIALWLTLTSSVAANIGYLGGLVRLVPGWWSVFFALSLGLLAIWSTWGMWSSHKKLNDEHKRRP